MKSYNTYTIHIEGEYLLINNTIYIPIYDIKEERRNKDSIYSHIHTELKTIPCLFL